MLINLSRKNPGYDLAGNTNPAKEKMTLDEILDYDDENHVLILKECKLTRFEKREPAGVFHWESWRRCMKKLGCVAMERFWKEIDFKKPQSMQLAFLRAQHSLMTEMSEKGIQVEGPSQRKVEQFEENKESWKIGKYVYYKGDIVYFISDVLQMRRRRGLIYLPGGVDYCVMTNAPKE